MKSLSIAFLLFVSITTNSKANPDTVSFITVSNTDTITPGLEFCLEFHTKNFNNIVAFQSQLNWNPDELEYLTSFQTFAVLEGLLQFNAEDVEIGELPFLWTHELAERQSLPDSTFVFHVCFRVAENLSVDTVKLNLSNSLISSQDDNGEYCESDVLLLDLGTQACIPISLPDNLTRCTHCSDAGTESHCHLCSVTSQPFRFRNPPCPPPCDEQPDQPSPLCIGAGAPHDVSWFSFMPNSSNITVEIIAENCVSGCGGVGSGIYDLCEGECIAGQGSCGNESYAFAYILSDLVEGQTYYLFVDGCCGSSCDITIRIFNLLESTTYYADNDGDGFGDSNNILMDCTQPDGYVLDDSDCDDNDPNNFPGNTEICDGQDNDCDGEIDENAEPLILTCCGATANSVSICWDDYPNATEYDVTVTINNTATTQFTIDVSQLDIQGLSSGDDVRVTVMVETSDSCQVEAVTISCMTNLVDQDMDGFDASEDCDDTDPEVFPGNPEVCDGKDNDCDGEVDEDFNLTTYYFDNDADGFGDQNNSVEACEQPMGYVEDDTDCDDTNADINPEAEEQCNDVDDNCNNEIDEGLSFITYYADNDGDGFGDPLSDLTACELPSGYVIDDTDCDDTNPDVNPNAPEIPGNGIDEDCDGIDGPSSTLSLDGTSIQVYPNPVSDILNIIPGSGLEYSIELLDLSGKAVVIDQQKQELDLSRLSNGIYILKITDLRTMRIAGQKIIISH